MVSNKIGQPTSIFILQVTSEVLFPRHAGVYTAEEVALIMRDKLIRLQSLYIDQFKRLQHVMRERRRKYLHTRKYERTTFGMLQFMLIIVLLWKSGAILDLPWPSVVSPRSGHMWESQVLDGLVVFPWVLGFSPTFDERSAQYKWNTVDSRYLEFQGTLWNTSRYLYFDISDLRKN